MKSSEPHPGARPWHSYSFDSFTLDVRNGLLLRDGQRIDLRSKSVEVLVYLVERHGRLVTRDELMSSVWPDVAVGDESLTRCVADIRKALGDESQRIVRTVPRRGYLFAALVTMPISETAPRVQVDSPARLTGVPGRRSWLLIGAAVALAAVIAVATIVVSKVRSTQQPFTFEQITNFTDSAVSPALSPDGKMVAFIRSDQWFLTTGEIYIKLLPNGEPVQITHDPRMKYAPTFSPDGSRILYTVGVPWATYSVSPFGGEPALFMNNASGVAWLDQHRLLFSEVRPPRSVHMGVVTAKDDRSELRTVYFPQEQRGMVHVSYPSPDGKWAIALEMNPIWQPCRLIPLDASSSGRQVGPKGNCTSAAWSPNGKWMYFGAEVDGQHHLWRQRFPSGQPEQITFGPTEEDGVAVERSGRSLITSIGMHQGVLWLHNGSGSHAISYEGNVNHPDARPQTTLKFTRDGKALFYLSSASPGAPQELWKADVTTEKSTKVLPGVSIAEFDISDDGREIVYSTQTNGRLAQFWLATLDRSSSPRVILAADVDFPHFGTNGRIIFRSFDGQNHYFEEMDRDGSRRSRLFPYPVGNGFDVSPDRRWITEVGTMPDGTGGTFAVPIAGRGSPQRICSGYPVFWAPDGKFLYVSLANAHKTRAIPLPPGEMLPNFPPKGNAEDPTLFPSATLIDNEYVIAPSSDPSVYAFVMNSIHRNLFRIPLRD